MQHPALPKGALVATVNATADTAAPASHPRRGVLRRVFDLVSRQSVQIALLIIALLWLTPTVGLLITSFRSRSENNISGWWHAITQPSQFTLHAYQTLIHSENPSMLHALVNTALITIPATVLLVAIAALAAYAFSWMDFRGREALFLIVVGLLVVPLQVALIPVASLYRSLGIFGTIPGVVIFHIAFGLPFAVFLLRNFFIGIPHELLEAARMDGAGELTIFLRVIIPLGVPAIASLAIFQFMWVWNDLLVALVFASPSSAPLTVAIQSQMRQFGDNIDLIASGAFLQMVVPLAVFFAFQRYFVQGLLAGSSR
jgi:alpha-glucoside transport system permease protein